jgi:putative FmdB family regulatory protein
VPRYDYRCTGCGNEFELRQTFSEAGTGACPLCSGAGQRVFHAVPVIYKGSGFYTTDYGRPKRQEENGSKETKESKDGDKASTKAASDDKSSSSDKSSSGDKSASSETSGKESSGSGSSSSADTKSESSSKAATETAS